MREKRQMRRMRSFNPTNELNPLITWQLYSAIVRCIPKWHHYFVLRSRIFSNTRIDSIYIWMTRTHTARKAIAYPINKNVTHVNLRSLIRYFILFYCFFFLLVFTNRQTPSNDQHNPPKKKIEIKTVAFEPAEEICTHHKTVYILNYFRFH